MSTEQKSPDSPSLSNPFFVLLLAHDLTPLNWCFAAETSLASTCFSHSALVMIISRLGRSAWLIWQKGRRGGGGCLIDSFEGLEPHSIDSRKAVLHWHVELHPLLIGGRRADGLASDAGMLDAT